MDCPIFEETAEAKLMLPYTGGEPRLRHAVLAFNLQSGGGFEIWQHKSRTPVEVSEEIKAGNLGIYACKIKVKSVKKLRHTVIGQLLVTELLTSLTVTCQRICSITINGCLAQAEW